MPDYAIYGLGLRTQDAIPGVKPADKTPDEVISVMWHPYQGQKFEALDGWEKVEVPPARRRRRISIYRPQDEVSARWMLVLHTDNFGDVACIYDDAAHTLDIHHPDDMSYEDCCSYFLGAVLGFVLRILGRFALHASAVAIEGRAVLFIGPKGAGKSTTAAAIAYQQGAEVISDDIAILEFEEAAISVHRAYGALRLHEDALSELADEDPSDALPVYSFVNKSYVFPAVSEVRETDIIASVPVRAVYFLAPRDKESPDAACINKLSVHDMMPQLAANTYASGAVIGPQAIADEFRMLGRLASEVPGFMIENRSTLERLEDLSECIADHIKGLGDRS